jgi:hypothetical protein
MVLQAPPLAPCSVVIEVLPFITIRITSSGDRALAFAASSLCRVISRRSSVRGPTAPGGLPAPGLDPSLGLRRDLGALFLIRFKPIEKSVCGYRWHFLR